MMTPEWIKRVYENTEFQQHNVRIVLNVNVRIIFKVDGDGMFLGCSMEYSGQGPLNLATDSLLWETVK